MGVGVEAGREVTADAGAAFRGVATFGLIGRGSFDVGGLHAGRLDVGWLGSGWLGSGLLGSCLGSGATASIPCICLPSPTIVPRTVLHGAGVLTDESDRAVGTARATGVATLVP